MQLCDGDTRTVPAIRAGEGPRATHPFSCGVSLPVAQYLYVERLRRCRDELVRRGLRVCDHVVDLFAVQVIVRLCPGRHLHQRSRPILLPIRLGLCRRLWNS